MKALLLDSPGTPDSLRLGETDLPIPGPGEVRVKVHAVGLNPADYKFMARGIGAWTYPHIPGLDVAGVIDAVGEGVDTWKAGDGVVYHGDYRRPGGFADYATTTSRTLVALPKNLAMVEAAALPCAGFTAYQVLFEKLNIKAGQTLFVQGGAGGVGGFAIQLAARMGLEVITTASESNADWVRSLGAAWSLDYNRESLPERIREITAGEGVDAIVDTVSTATATEGLSMLAFGGSIACVAGLPDPGAFRSFGMALSVHDIALGGAYHSGSHRAQRRLAATGEAFVAMVQSHAVNPMVAEVIGLEEIPQALVKLSGRRVRGKIVARLTL
jgi:NADPH:quinone reductase-like Zn-dependent oxidoreductase